MSEAQDPASRWPKALFNLPTGLCKSAITQHLLGTATAALILTFLFTHVSKEFYPIHPVLICICKLYTRCWLEQLPDKINSFIHVKEISKT